MDVDSPTNAVTGEHFEVERTDDSCRFEYIEIVPLATVIDGSCATKYVNGDWSAEVKQEDLAVVKQEPDSGDESSAMCFVESDAVPATLDEALSHVQPVLVQDTPNLAGLQKNCHTWINTGDRFSEVKNEADSNKHPVVGEPRPHSCTLGGIQLTPEGYLNNRKERPIGGKVYSCTLCPKQFLSCSGLRHHVNVHGLKYKCTECGRCCRDSNELAKHRQKHSGEKPFECLQCQKHFLSSDGLRHHMNVHGLKYKCTECGKCCRDSNELAKHVQTHLGDKPLVCMLCPKRFLSLDGLRHHMNIHSLKYKCTECGKCCRDKSELARHRQKHSAEKPSESTVCSKQFAGSVHVTADNRICSSQKPYSCHICDTVFHQPRSLNSHMRMHTRDRLFTCRLCDKRFNRFQHLIRHMTIHSGEKPYGCSICDKAFNQAESLRIHVRVHTGDKPFVCYLCNKTFSRAEHLTRHVRIHTGEKPYSCRICYKVFNQSGSVKSHMRVHTGNKPHKCSLCNTSFSFVSQLQRHKRSMHG